MHGLSSQLLSNHGYCWQRHTSSTRQVDQHVLPKVSKFYFACRWTARQAKRIRADGTSLKWDHHWRFYGRTKPMQLKQAFIQSQSLATYGVPGVMQLELLVGLLLELKAAGNDFEVVLQNRRQLPSTTYKVQLAQQVRSVFEASSSPHSFPSVATSFPGVIPSSEPSWPSTAPYTKQQLWQWWRAEVTWAKKGGRDNMWWQLIFWGEPPVTGKTPKTEFWALLISNDPKACSLYPYAQMAAVRSQCKVRWLCPDVSKPESPHTLYRRALQLVDYTTK